MGCSFFAYGGVASVRTRGRGRKACAGKAVPGCAGVAAGAVRGRWSGRDGGAGSSGRGPQRPPGAGPDQTSTRSSSERPRYGSRHSLVWRIQRIRSRPAASLVPGVRYWLIPSTSHMYCSRRQIPGRTRHRPSSAAPDLRSRRASRTCRPPGGRSPRSRSVPSMTTTARPPGRRTRHISPANAAARQDSDTIARDSAEGVIRPGKRRGITCHEPQAGDRAAWLPSRTRT